MLFLIFLDPQKWNHISYSIQKEFESSSWHFNLLVTKVETIGSVITTKPYYNRNRTDNFLWQSGKNRQSRNPRNSSRLNGGLVAYKGMVTKCRNRCRPGTIIKGSQIVSQLSLEPTNPTLQSTTISQFLCNVFPQWPLIFLVITIHQVIWPSPGTLKGSHEYERLRKRL